MIDEVDKYRMTKGFVFQPSFFKQINRKTRVGDRERAYRYICEYVFLGKVPEVKENDILADFWDGTYPILHKLKAMSIASTASSTKRSTKASTKDSTTDRLSTDLLQGEERIKEKDKGEGVSKENIGTPTLDDVRKFAQDNKLKVNPTRFYKYYQARGWQANGQPIHDWKALLESWVETDEPEKPEKSYKPIEPFKTCPVCGSGETSQQGMYAMCLNPECDKTFTWINNEWREDR